MKKIFTIITVAIFVVLIFSFFSKPKTAEKNNNTTQASIRIPSDNIYLTKKDVTKGRYLADFQGKTLYIYDKDTNGVSNCSGSCTKNWIPYSSGAVTQSSFPVNVSVITRIDGNKQFAWKGQPLYYYATDQNAGDITGDGINGVWHIVKP